MKATFLVITILFADLCLAQSAKQYRQSFNHFIELDSSNIVMVPIDWDNNAKLGGVKIMGNNRTKNILFYDPTTDQQNILFDDSLQMILAYSGQRIRRFYERDLDTVERLNYEHLYYSVVSEDYNNDDKLDTDDPTYLYYSKIDGTGLEQLTPRAHHLKHYTYIKSSNVILAVIISDDNGDKKFNSKDSEILFKVDLNDTSRSKSITKLKLKDSTE